MPTRIASAGFFAAPSAIEAAITRQHDVQIIGRIDAVREQVFAITTERRLSHRITAAICQFAQHDMFGDGETGRKPE